MQPAYKSDTYNDGPGPAENPAAERLSASVASVPTSDSAAATARTEGSPAAPSPAAADATSLILQRQAAMLQMVAEYLDQPSLQTAVTALVGELHHRFRCDRVCLGLFQHGRLDLVAISQQASIDPLSPGVLQIVAAMQEACDQDSVIQYPHRLNRKQITEAHQVLTADRPSVRVVTFPMAHHGQWIGALQFDLRSSQAWSRFTVELLRQMAAVAAPMIALRMQAERSLRHRVRDSLHQQLQLLLGPRHTAWKLAALLASVLLLGGAVVPVTHRVSGSGELVPLERRVITAPQLGYIHKVQVGAGDRVREGQLLLELDTRELLLEKENRQNEIRNTETRIRSAMADHDRKEMAIARAKHQQAQAQLALIEQQIQRSRLVSPSPGVVMSGDLSQSIGAPVERGQVLLEIAPDTGYKVQFMIDESDIGFVKPGQTGRMTVRSDPGRPLAVIVTEIYPIASAGQGRNRFRVDASLTQPTPGLRPGQTGIGKIDVGDTTVLWSTTHKFYHWLKLTLWELLG